MLKKLLIFIGVMLFFSFTFSSNIYASTILFQDDFENGLSKWNILYGGNLWQVKEINGSKWLGATINSPSTIIAAAAGDTLWTNYEVEMDMYPIQGIDKNIILRWDGQNFCNQFHFNPNIHMNYDDPNIPYFMTNNVIHHVKYILKENNYKLYIDGQQIVNHTITSQNPPCLTGSIGLVVSSGAAWPTEIWFDNVVVRNLDEAPTLTPTPTPVNLNVPSLKQTSSPWGSQLYDSAMRWARNTTISSWGCALTSATMVLNYHGFNLLPNGTVLNPGTLNSWLKSQVDGYIGNGFVNWLALSRLSKVAKSVNGITDFDALEYERKWTSDIEILTDDIKNLMPDIIEESGHYIVGKGVDGNVIKINDPYFDRQTLDDYSNTFLSLGTYSQTSTDLSYIMIVMDPDVEINVKDAALNDVGNSFVQQEMVSDSNPSESNSPVKIFYLNKPNSQTFKLSLSSLNNKLTNFKIYLYNQDGTVKIVERKALLGTDGNTFELNFNKENLSNSTIERKITINDLIKDVIKLRNLKLIHKDFAEDLLDSANEVKEELRDRDKEDAKEELISLQKILKKASNKSISPEAKNFLLSDASYLLKTL